MTTPTTLSPLARLQQAWPAIWKDPAWMSPVTVAWMKGPMLVLHARTAERILDVQRDTNRIMQEASKVIGRNIKQVVCEFSPLLSDQEFRAENSRLECPVGLTEVNHVLGCYWDMHNKLKASDHPAAVLLRYSNRLAKLASRALEEERRGGIAGGVEAAVRMAEFLSYHDLDAEMPKGKGKGKAKALRGAA